MSNKQRQEVEQPWHTAEHHPPAKKQTSWVTMAIIASFFLVPASVVLSFIGSLFESQWMIDIFWVDKELMNSSYVFSFNFPVIVSGVFLLGASLAWIWVATRSQFRGSSWAMGFAIFVAFMGFDELLVLHERLERHFGVDWQIMYLPIIAVGALGWGGLLWRLRHRQRRSSVALFMGAALWGFSQVLEFVQWHGGMHASYHYLVAFEETFESWGSLTFLWAAVILLKDKKSGTRTMAGPSPRRSI